jgi:hypothetical protein
MSPRLGFVVGISIPEINPMTRQRRWQIRQGLLGLCAKCNKPAAVHARGKRTGTNYVYCEKHLAELREKNRARSQLKRWNQTGGDPLAWNAAVAWISSKFNRIPTA